MSNHLNQSLDAMRAALRQLQDGEIGIAALCAAWRAQGAVLAALPPRYEQVAEDLLGRLEAGSLFTEESCSFSQHDLIDSLNTWLDKATHTLAPA
ncbi:MULTISPECIES: hypothetical protein [unclassified Herbaspirillum]|uniref:hypothetical protein n=1 Tax=unclassified Herbaspirillum TaxID=2624150 RepID=UPI001153CF1B|nr:MULTISPECIES: hypothetical protein [unclassified Herbaspirillum]MBB5391479.1 hypothetical protein [Herbaspirillum sp. SJZ102]TQK12837.1 hypothetical protein FB599_0243 [Herbaspirillum sp. SJZ130]TQK14841.1 hypothetical protein FB598_0181 [Herbaspirillum sp. SJZ106]